MTGGRGEGTAEVTIFVHPSEYFREVVDEALISRKIDTIPSVPSYLVEILSFYVSTENLFEERDSNGKRTQGMLAEKFLRANNADKASKIELLKKLGDMSLYISGFFGDSLQRKLVDIDYYVDMGEAAYQSLATVLEEEHQQRSIPKLPANLLILSMFLHMLAKSPRPGRMAIY